MSVVDTLFCAGAESVGLFTQCQPSENVPVLTALCPPSAKDTSAPPPSCLPPWSLSQPSPLLGKLETSQEPLSPFMGMCPTKPQYSKLALTWEPLSKSPGPPLSRGGTAAQTKPPPAEQVGGAEGGSRGELVLLIYDLPPPGPRV